MDLETSPICFGNARVHASQRRLLIDGGAVLAEPDPNPPEYAEGTIPYFVLGMGEDEQTTIDGCKRAIDMGVYPFIVPLRPVPGSLMEDLLPPPREAVEAVYRKVVPYLAK